MTVCEGAVVEFGDLELDCWPTPPLALVHDKAGQGRKKHDGGLMR
jgi:hypothetical protein